MIKLNDGTLKNSLNKDGVLRIYYITGNDEFLIDACCNTVMSAVFGNEEKSVTLFNAEKTSDEELEEFFMSFSLMSSNRVAIFDGFSVSSLTKARIELLEGLFKDIAEDITVILKCFVDDKRFSVPKKAEELISVNRSSAAVSVLQKSGGELAAYIERIAKREGCTVSDSNANRIAEMCANDLMLINNEIKKLAAYCDYKEIKKEHIDELCIRTAEAGVYDMIGFIERSDIKNAVRILMEMLDERTEPLMISAALNTAYINLYRARLVRESRQGEQKLFELFDYKKADRKVSIAYERSAKYSLRQIGEIIEILYDLDLKLKSSAVEKRYIIEEHIVKLSQKVSARV